MGTMAAMQEAPVEEIYLSIDDFEIWDDAERIFAGRDVMSLSEFRSKLGLINRTRRLIELGLITVDGKTVRRTGVVARQNRRVVSNGSVVDYHYGSILDDPKKPKANKDSGKKRRVTNLDLKEVRKILPDLTQEDRRHLVLILSAVTWDKKKALNQVDLIVYSTLCHQAGLFYSRKDIAEVLNLLGSDYSEKDMGFYIPSEFRALQTDLKRYALEKRISVEFNLSERKVLKSMISTVPWDSPGKPYRVTIGKTTEAATKLGIDTTKVEILSILDRLGVRTDDPGANYVVPVWFRDLRIEI